MKKTNTQVFDLKEVGFQNLDGQFVPINFDQKDFANALFANAQSIDMDDFARSIHKDGKAQLNEQVAAELPNLVASLYPYRPSQALKELIEKIITNGK